MGRPKVRVNQCAEKAIGLWSGAACNRTARCIGVNRAEMAAMAAVMRDTDGGGGPWFYQYSIKKGLLD